MRKIGKVFKLEVDKKNFFYIFLFFLLFYFFRKEEEKEGKDKKRQVSFAYTLFSLSMCFVECEHTE